MLLKAEEKKAWLETRNLQMLTVILLTGKGKYSVKVGNHLHTTMISKPVVVRRVQMQDIGNAFETKRPAT